MWKCQRGLGELAQAACELESLEGPSQVVHELREAREGLQGYWRLCMGGG